MKRNRSLFTVRDNCRICGSQSMKDIVDLGAQYPAGWLLDDEGSGESDRIPLQLIRCDSSRNRKACGLVQLRHSVSPDRLFSEYYYESGINRTMRGNLTEIVGLARSYVDLCIGDTVLDIGCNDGTLLEAYEGTGLVKIGFDPSDIVLNVRAGDVKAIREVFSADAFWKASKGAHAKVVTSIAMFYDLEDPPRFVNDVKQVLDEDGVWILEQSYLAAMLRNNAFDTICHEHLEYYSLNVIQKLLESQGLQIVSANVNAVNGGSIRLVVSHQGGRHLHAHNTQIIEAIKEKENKLNLTDDAIYQHFRVNIEQIRQDLREILGDAKSDGKLVHGYGASTKGNTVLQYCDIDSSLVPAIADRNPRKWGKYTIGSNIRVISEEESRRLRPDYYLVLPWHFITEFTERESDFLDRGGKFILPMPTVHLVP